MSTADRHQPGERVRRVVVDDAYVTFHLFDGRIVSVPLSWSPRLLNASPKERSNFVIGASRYGVHWPDLDEDLSGAGLLRGAPAPRRSLVPSSKEWTKGDVRRLRLRIGATVTAFADMLGVRRATASDWEHGKKGVSPMGQRLLDDLVERLDTVSIRHITGTDSSTRQ
ncbi:MAG TPA: DUF2442 domain-containing protein [Rhodothermales bacterium]